MLAQMLDTCLNCHVIARRRFVDWSSIIVKCVVFNAKQWIARNAPAQLRIGLGVADGKRLHCNSLVQLHWHSMNEFIRNP